MARYLTPASIGLLCLIELYRDQVVEVQSTVPILSFIVSHLLPSSLPKPQNNIPGAPARETSLNIIITPDDFQKVLQGHRAFNQVSGKTLWDAFLEELWGIDSLDALHEFFESRRELLQKTKEQVKKDREDGVAPADPRKIYISRTSPMGAFVRRAQLEFTRLKFHDAVNLWKAFVNYRQTTFDYYKIRHPEAGTWKFDKVLEGETKKDGEKEEWANAGMVSTNDIEKLLEFQIDQMQKLGERVPENVQDAFKQILSSDVVVPSLTHYVKFLDAWRAGDYPTSFDSLHRFFDYTMQNRDRSFYQYALLNLAVLQSDFGCHQEAVAAMLGSVKTARENKDMGCLNFSLSWLNHFSKNHPNEFKGIDKSNILGTEREALAFLRLKAKESGMWSLWSSTLLGEAKTTLSKGESIASVFENILRSSELSVTKNLMSGVGVQMMLESSLWSRLGVAHLSWSYCEIFLRTHSKFAPFDDILKFTCRSAYMLAQKGHFTAARAKLRSLDKNSLRSLKAAQYHTLYCGIIQLQQVMHTEKTADVDIILQRLLQSRGGDPDLTFELNMMHIDALMRRGEFSTALTTIETLASNLHGDNEDVFFRAKLLCLKANVFIKCGRPQKGFSIAVRAATIAWRARILVTLWEAMGLVSAILISLHEFVAAEQILTSIIPRALECQDPLLVATLWMWKVDATMGQAGQAPKDSEKRKEKLRLAVAGLDRAAQYFTDLAERRKMRECQAKKAVVLWELGEGRRVMQVTDKYDELRLEEGLGSLSGLGEVRYRVVD